MAHKLQHCWRFLIIPLFVVTILHFIKDITQDILGVSTFLDKIGDINENISNFPVWLTWLYHWAMVNTFFMEGALLVTLPLDWKNKRFTKFSIINISMVLYIIALFIVAYLLQ
ncbi:MAG: hypothetical protein WC069_00695 [Candidatus Shapirobacteria bacterium]